MIDFEVGDVTFWVSIDSTKPFPINVFTKEGQWQHRAYKDALTPEEEIIVNGFVKQILGDMNEVWKPNMKRRLLWDTARLKRKKVK